MKKNDITYLLKSFFFVSIILQLQSCTKEYDLSKDIDLTMHVGGSKLSVPIGSTDSIKLSTIIKVNESDVLQLSGGEYSLYKQKTINPISVSVENTEPANVDIINIQSGSISSVGNYYNGEINIPKVSAPLEIKQNNLPTSILSIKSFDLPQYLPAKVTIRVSATGVTSGANIKLENYKVTFPDFIVSGGLNSNNELIIQNESLTSEIKKDIYINTIDFSKATGEQLVIQNQKLDVQKDVTIDGQILTANMNANTVIGDVRISTSINIEPIYIWQVQGQVNPKIDVSISPMTFDIPSFLTDDAVTLDVLDPMILIYTNNKLSIPIVVNGTIQGFRNGKQLSNIGIEDAANNPIVINPNKYSIDALSNSGTAGPADSNKYQIAQLSNLLKKLPNEVHLTMNAYTDQRSIHKIELGKQYQVEMSYAMEAPLRFGTGLSIVYNDSIDKLNKGIKDLEVTGMVITATAENNIPLALQVEATAVGINKSAGAIPGISVKVTGDIQPCDKNGNSQQSPIVIEMVETVAGAIKKLDGVLLKVTAKSSETVSGMPLKDTQYLRLTNIRAKTSSGLSIDLNKK